MKSYAKLLELVNELIERDEKQKEKWVKAESLRIRKVIGEIQKIAVEAKRDLVERDSK